MSDVFNSNEFVENLKVLEAHVKGASAKGLIESGEHILGQGQEACPVETGNLKGSATLDDSKADQGEVTIGFNTDYAAAVHERDDVAHDQGEAKFLENAIKRELPRVIEIIGKEIAQQGLRD